MGFMRQNNLYVSEAYYTISYTFYRVHTELRSVTID